MITDTLVMMAGKCGFTYEPMDEAVYGQVAGYTFSIRGLEGKNCYIVESWAKQGEHTEANIHEWIKSYSSMPDKSFLTAYKLIGTTLASIIASKGNDDTDSNSIYTYVNDVAKFYASNYFVNCCCKCGSGENLIIEKNYKGNYSQFCQSCYEKDKEEGKQAAQKSAEQVSSPMQSNMNNAPQMNGMPSPMGANPVNNMGTAQTMGAIGMASVGGNQGMASVGGNQGMASVGGNQGMASVGGNQGMASVGGNQGMASVGGVENLGANSQAMGSVGGPMGDFDMNTGTTVGVMDMAQTRPVGAPPITGAGNTMTAPYTAPISPVKAVKANPILGIAGAVIGALLGSIVIIIIGLLGFISWIGGLVLAFTTVTGFKLCGKRFNIAGLIICLFIVCLAVLGSTMACGTIQFVTDAEFMAEIGNPMGYTGFFDIFFDYFNFLDSLDLLLEYVGETPDIMSSFISDLVLTAAFSVIPYLLYAIPSYKADR